MKGGRGNILGKENEGHCGGSLYYFIRKMNIHHISQNGKEHV
jgi:hypothetical protein